MLSRVRQCNWCKANVRGYDHHCPVFGTCIGIIFHVPLVNTVAFLVAWLLSIRIVILSMYFAGQKNHRLFMALLTGFVVAESTYTMCSTKCMMFVSLICEKLLGFS